MFMRNECKYYAPCGLCTYYNKPCDETTKITKPVCNNVSDETQNYNQLSDFAEQIKQNMDRFNTYEDDVKSLFGNKKLVGYHPIKEEVTKSEIKAIKAKSNLFDDYWGNKGLSKNE